MRHTQLIVVTLLLTAMASTPNGWVMTDVKWLFWPPLLILAATPAAGTNWHILYRLGVSWALINQMLLLYRADALFVSMVSVAILAMLAVAPGLAKIVRPLRTSSRQRALLMVSILGVVLFTAGLHRVTGMMVPDSWGRQIYSAPFGYKTELAALVLVLMVPLRIVNGGRSDKIAFVSGAILLLLSGSRAGWLGLMLLQLWRWRDKIIGPNRNPAGRKALTFMLILSATFIPVGLAAWLLHDPSAWTRLYLWSAAIRSQSWLYPFESGAALAAVLAAQQLHPLLVHGGVGRFPLQLHNDLLALLLAGGWILFPFVVYTRRLWTQVHVGWLLPLLPLLVMDSLVVRPVGLFVLAVAIGLAVPGATVEESSAVRKYRYPVVAVLSVLWLLWAALPFVPRLCLAAPAYTVSSARSCGTRMDPAGGGWDRLRAWIDVAGRDIPAYEVMYLNWLHRRGMRREWNHRMARLRELGWLPAEPVAPPGDPRRSMPNR